MASEEEEEYFHRLQADERAKLRKKLEAEAEELKRRQTKLELGERINKLGFSGETIAIFDLLPLVHVAWADGKIQRGERAAIFKVLEQRGIPSNSQAHAMMAALLEVKPSQAYLDESLAVLHEAVGPARSQSIVDMCVAVAQSAGGFFGMRKGINDEERVLIEAIAAQLGKSAQSELGRQLAEH